MIRKIYNHIRDIYVRSFKDGIRVSRKASVIGSELQSYVHISEYAFVYESRLGCYTTVGKNSVIRNAVIGKFCSISWNVTVGASQHRYDLPSTHAFHYIKSFDFVEQDLRLVDTTRVGNDVWIGADAILLPGITIGSGAVVGAGAVVVKSVPPYAIVVGVPAKVIKYRFDEETVEKLLNLAWWDWDRLKIEDNLEWFQNPVNVDVLSHIKDR